MNEHQIKILAEARQFVTEIFQNKLNPLFVFHNLDHTQQVVSAAEEIKGFYDLDDNDQFVLLISAWFHDTGFTAGQAEEHEKESIKLAVKFLHHRYADQEIIIRVSSCIQATHMPQMPLSQIEKIICDADLYHLGTDCFSKMNDRLRREFRNYFKKEFSIEEWLHDSIRFLKSHKYFTDYCQQKLETVKQEWIEKLQNKQGAVA